MKPLPSTVTCGPYTVTVVVDGTQLDVHAMAEGQDKLAGQMRATSQVILLRDGMAGDYAAEVLVHELIHLAAVVAGNPWDGELEERVAATLAPALLHALRSPGVTAYLLDPTGT